MPGEEIGPVVDLQEIFAAPMLAVIRANIMAAREFLAFIESVGFVRDPTDPSQMLGELRMVTLSYEQAGAAGEPPAKRFFSIPVLSLVPLPLLEVKDATFDFGVRLIAAFEPMTERSVRALPPPEPTEDPLDMRWRAMLAVGRSTVGAETKPDLAPHLEANMNVKVNFGQADIPSGIQNLLALMGENARLSSALLTVWPTECRLDAEFRVRDFILKVINDRRRGYGPAGVELLYAPDSRIEVRTSDDQPWPSGQTRWPDERGVLNASVRLTDPAPIGMRRISLVFRTDVAGAVAIVELVCIVVP